MNFCRGRTEEGKDEEALRSLYSLILENNALINWTKEKNK